MADQNNRQPEQMLPFEVIGQFGGVGAPNPFEQGQGVAAAAAGAPGTATTTAGATAPGPASAEPTTPISTHQLEHVGVRCDHCNKTVTGFRYKCCQCRDYDLCAACEQLGIHAGHVMLRIPFPEMARDAIRAHIVKASRMRDPRSPSPPPVIHLGFGGVSAAPGTAAEEADRHCGGRRGGHGGKRHRGHHGHGHPYHRQHDESSTSAESSDEAAPFPFNYGPGGCPVMAGKKEMKKWAKCMKKNAYVHKKAAQEYAKRMSGAGAAAGATADANAPGATGQVPQGFDLAAAAHQIQEFLNAAGIPIDVVELYNEWGSSHGTAGASTNAPNATANAEATGTEQQASGGVSAAAEAPAATATTESSNVNANLAENLSHLNIGSGATAQAPAAVTTATATPTPTSAAAAAAVAMDVEGVPAPAATPGQAPRIYPQLNPAHFQQMMTGISNAVGNVARNIPIVPWNAHAPSAPAAGATVTATPPSTPAAGNQTQPELGDRMQQTLNQLLSMGFSNHDGWLGRLVASKKGNLEEVLNALFPVGGGNAAGGAAAGPGAGGNGPHTLD